VLICCLKIKKKNKKQKTNKNQKEKGKNILGKSQETTMNDGLMD